MNWCLIKDLHRLLFLDTFWYLIFFFFYIFNLGGWEEIRNFDFSACVAVREGGCGCGLLPLLSKFTKLSPAWDQWN